MKSLKRLSLICLVITTQTILLCCCRGGLAFYVSSHRSRFVVVPLLSLKPAAVPLLESGKALARAGEVLIEYTTSIEIYGGALSSAGASLRNAGDCVAQAAASCRFKTGIELVSDELREAATCIVEGTKLLSSAIGEAIESKDETMAVILEASIKPMKDAGLSLEAAGSCMMQGRTSQQTAVGQHFVSCGSSLRLLSELILELPTADIKSENKQGHKTIQLVKMCSQRMQFAAETMIEAGNNLSGSVKKV
jgi:hypothetical protein